MKPAIQYTHPQGDQVWIDPACVGAMQERYKDGQYYVVLFTAMRDTIFEVKGNLKEVLGRFADK